MVATLARIVAMAGTVAMWQGTGTGAPPKQSKAKSWSKLHRSSEGASGVGSGRMGWWWWWCCCCCSCGRAVLTLLAEPSSCMTSPRMTFSEATTMNTGTWLESGSGSGLG